MTKKKLRFKKRNILSILGIILLTVFLVLFFKLGIVPINSAVIIALLVLGLLLILGIFLANRKNDILKTIGIILLLISIFINGLGIFVLYHVNNFFDKAFKEEVITSTSTYYLVTSKKSGLTKKDVKGNILYYESNKDITKANKKLKEAYENITLKKSDNANEMFKQISEDKEKLMFIEKKFYSSIFDFDKTLNEDDYVILDKINIKSKITSKRNKSNSFNIYLWGSDFTDMYMDFNMIVTVNPDTNKILLTSIPRDYYIPVAGHDGQRDKLSFMGAQGVDTVVKSVEDYFGTKIDYYVTFNAKNVPQVIDTLGGVEYCSDEAYSVAEIKLTPGVRSGYKGTGRKIYVKEGCQTISGIEAVSVVRPRTQFVGGDAKRQEYIRKVIVGVLKKVKDPNTVMNYSNIMDSMSDLYQMTIPRNKINYLVKTTIKNGGNWEIIEQSVNGEDGHDKVFLSDFVDWVKYPYEEDVKNASKQINDLLK